MIPSLGKTQHLDFQHLSELHLPNRHVNAFHQDIQGFVWMGTLNGAVKFDGKLATVYTAAQTPTFKGKNTTGFLNDSIGNIWIGSDRGLFYYNKKSNSFKNYPLIPEPNSGNCWAKPLGFDKNGQILVFVATTYRLYSFDPLKNKLTKHPYTLPIVCQSKTINSTLLLAGSDNKGVTLISESSDGIQYFHSRNLPWLKNWNQASILFSNSELWLGGEKGLAQIPITDRGFGKPTFLFPSISNVTCLAEDDLYLWIGTAENGVYQVNKSNRQLIAQYKNHPADPKSLSTGSCRALFSTGNSLYISFADGGVDFADLSPEVEHWMHIDEVERCIQGKNSITAIADFSNDTWLIGTQNSGICLLNKQTGNILETTSSLLNKKVAAKHISQLLKTQNGWLILSREGVFLLQSSTLTCKQLLNEAVNYGALVDAEHALISSNEGLFSVDIQQSNVQKVEDFFRQNHAHNLHILSKGNKAWVLAEWGSNLTELTRSSSGKWTVSRTFWLPENAENIGFWDNENTAFLTTPSGFLLFDLVRFQLVKNTPKLPIATGIVQLIPHKSKLYILHSNGLSILSKKSLSTIQSFSSINGLEAQHFVADAFTVGDFGWICGTPNGIFCGSATDSKSKIVATPYIAEWTINEQPSTEPLNSNRLTYQQNTLAFQLSAVHPKGKIVQGLWYRLLPLEKSGVLVNNSGWVRYPQLQPGKYVLEIGGDQCKTVTYTFVISKPFWQTAWFLLLVLTFSIATIYLIYRYRLKQIQKVHQTQLRISRDLHDDIGGTLTSISILSNLALEANDTTQQKTFLEKIKNDSSEVLNNVRDIIWSLNDTQHSAEYVIIRLKEQTQLLLSSREVAVTWNISNFENIQLLSSNQLRSLYLILKEIITNTAKYSKSTEVTVTMNASKTSVEISVTDNGVGFNTEKVTGNGLNNIQKRINQLSGSCIINSNIGEGTQIMIHIPIKP